jgi:probable F420-dependent oxidoreductase
MQIGVHVPTTVAPDVTRDALLTFAREAEARDFVSLWVSDHVVIPRATAGYPGGRSFPVPPDVPYLEPVAMLSALAMATTRARIGCSVFILGHRHPVAMAKMLATIDVLSGGRLICGVGVGWWRQELEILGVDFARRGRAADEALRVFKALWTEREPRFAGEFYRVADVGFEPKPVQKPHPPIWVGGNTTAALRRVVALDDDRDLDALRAERDGAGRRRAGRRGPSQRVCATGRRPHRRRVPARGSQAHARAARSRRDEDPAGARALSADGSMAAVTRGLAVSVMPLKNRTARWRRSCRCYSRGDGHGPAP